MNDKITLEVFKTAALSEDFTDEEIIQLFVKVEICSGKEINEVIYILKKHRPNAYKILEEKIKQEGPQP